VAYYFGIMPDEFWGMIPRELYKYLDMQVDRDKTKREADQRNTALICATIANFSMTKPKNKKYKIDDFIPKEKKEMTEEDMLKEVEKINRLLGGKDLRQEEGVK